MVANTKPFFRFTCIVSIRDKFHMSFKTQLVCGNKGIFSFAGEFMQVEDEKQEINRPFHLRNRNMQLILITSRSAILLTTARISNWLLYKTYFFFLNLKVFLTTVYIHQVSYRSSFINPVSFKLCAVDLS